MSGGDGSGSTWGIGLPQPPILAPPQNLVEIGEKQRYWSSFDDSVNAVSFGLMATAILVSMFLVMAIFERFLWSGRGGSRSQNSSFTGGISTTMPSDIESQPLPQSHLINYPKFCGASPKMSIYTNGMPVLMPGEDVPTFIAQPAPPPCPPEPVISRPLRHDMYNTFCSNFFPNR